MLCFWNKIVGNPDKLSGKIYRLLFKLFISGNRDILWMNYIKSIFDETGFSNIWDGQKYINLFTYHRNYICKLRTIIILHMIKNQFYWSKDNHMT